MTRLSMFNSPLLLGFDQFERAFERVSKTASDGYPPYNIERVDDFRLRITLAVAGFSRKDLAVHVEGNQLVVRGKQSDGQDANRVFLHRGIASRQFQRSFVLAEGVEVVGASLENGLLYIDIMKPEADNRVRRINIETAEEQGRDAGEGHISVTARSQT